MWPQGKTVQAEMKKFKKWDRVRIISGLLDGWNGTIVHCRKGGDRYVVAFDNAQGSFRERDLAALQGPEDKYFTGEKNGS